MTFMIVFSGLMAATTLLVSARLLVKPVAVKQKRIRKMDGSNLKDALVSNAVEAKK
jgi:hypothetical protein